MNIYYLIISVIEYNTREIYSLFTPAVSYKEAVYKFFEQLFDEDAKDIEIISLKQFYETDMFVSKTTADRIIADLNEYPVVEKEKL